MSGGMSFAPETTRTINVDWSTASDKADQIQAQIDGIGKYIPYGVTVTLQFGDGSYTLNHELQLNDFYGGGTLRLQGNTAESGLHTNQAVTLDFHGQSSSGIVVNGCSLEVLVSNMKIIVNTSTTTTYAVRGANSSYLYVNGCYLLGTDPTYGNLAYQTAGGFQRVVDTYISNAQYGLAACYGATLLSMNNASTGTTPAIVLYACQGGTIGRAGSQPVGTQVDSTGGEIR